MIRNERLGHWRKSPVWNTQTLEDLKSDIRAFTPPACRDIGHVNILLMGPINAGKSSFFNTISSVFKGRLSSQACCGSAEKSITTTFRTYRVRDKGSDKASDKGAEGTDNVSDRRSDRGPDRRSDRRPDRGSDRGSDRVLPFRLCDTRGLEEEEMLDEQELKYVLNGNIFDGYKHGSIQQRERQKQSNMYRMMGYLLPKYFSVDHELPGFRARSAYDSEIHCVCFVLDGSTAGIMSDKMVNKIKLMQRTIRDRGLPQLFLMTKVDKVCTMVNDNLSDIFCSPDVLDLVENIATLFGVPRSHVLPIKNFENEADVSLEIAILALLSLKFMLSSAEDFLFDVIDRGDDIRSSDALS